MADAIKPYYTSDDLINAIKRKISLPLSQNTFDEDDILRFCNEEMFISQVPSVLMYHDEYFVFPVEVSLSANTSRYSIPSRAIGSKMRDLSFKDSSGNLFEMTRINPDDRTFHQDGGASNNTPYKYYIENTEIVLIPEVTGTPTGSLVFYIYLRPNQLVQNSRSAILSSLTASSTSIKKNLKANSSFIQTGADTFTIASHGFPNGARLTFSTTGTLPDGITAGTTYYVVNTATNTFQVSETLGGSAIDITSVGTGIHTVTRTKVLTKNIDVSDVDFDDDTITIANHDFTDGDKVILSTTDTLPTPLVVNKLYYVVESTTNSIKLSLSSGGTPINITYSGDGVLTVDGDLTVLTFEDDIPDNIEGGNYIDFLQTVSGHKTYSYDVLVPSNGISGSSLTMASSDIPSGFSVGDYICTAHECIVPQIPSDLHNGLAERAAARILASIGDTEGLQTVNQKIKEINENQGALLDNRAEGSPLKVTSRHSLLRYGKRRRF